ncbi:hypothetical protein BS17DRAFT_525474 [Gyrodon lividus]|nr:hypothetical protein BS17DRAFT_525474 [Gyrodon lividus]
MYLLFQHRQCNALHRIDLTEQPLDSRVPGSQHIPTMTPKREHSAHGYTHSFAIIMFFLVALTLMNAMYTALQLENLVEAATANHPSYSYAGSDIPSELPLDLRQVALMFEDVDEYALNASAEWSTLIPPRNGWVHLGPEGRPFAISLYHQLHCLSGIRSAILRAQAQACNATDFTPSFLSHANHCFNYIRQTLLCHADTTLESTQKIIRPNGKLGFVASGVNILHRCRDWTQVRSFVERLQASLPQHTGDV